MSENSVTCCPECKNGVSLHLRTNKPRSERWKCRACRATFEKLDRREPESPTTHNGSSTQAHLLAADPDDYPRGDA